MGEKYIKWDFTGRCNLRCAHCSVGKVYFEKDREPIRELTAQERLQVVDKLAAGGVGAVTFLGGEPLLLKDELFDVAARCAAHGIAMSLVTNGLLLREEAVHKVIDSGIGTLVVSVDGASAKTHELIRGKGTYERVIANLDGMVRTIRREGAPVKVRVNTVLNRQNAHEIRQMLDMWIEKDVDEWGALALGGVGYAEDHIENLYLAPEEEIELAVEFAKCWNARSSATRLDVFAQFIYPVIADYIEEKYGLEVPRPMLCCNAATSLGFIRPDGTMYACDRVPNDRYTGKDIDGAAIRPMSLVDHDFYEIWNSDYFRAMFPFILRADTYQNYDPCRRCKYLHDRSCNPCPLYSLDSNVVVHTCKLIEEWTGGFGQGAGTDKQPGLLDTIETIRVEPTAPSEAQQRDSDRVPTPRQGIRSYAEGDQLVLLNPYDVTFIAVNPVGRMLWESMDGHRCIGDFAKDLEDVAEGVAARIGARETPADLEKYLMPQVQGFFTSLAERGLIEWA